MLSYSKVWFASGVFVLRLCTIYIYTILGKCGCEPCIYSSSGGTGDVITLVYRSMRRGLANVRNKVFFVPNCKLLQAVFAQPGESVLFSVVCKDFFNNS